MRSYPDDADDRKDLARLKAEPWMVKLLRLNPKYVYWGPHEDYMCGDKEGWSSKQLFASWRDFGPWKLDDLNEVANFYFEVDRENEKCGACDGNGYHPDAQWVSESFYRHSSPFKTRTAEELQVKMLLSKVGVEDDHGVHGQGVFPDAETLSKYGKAFHDFCDEMRAGDGSWKDRLTDDEWDALIEHKRVKEKGKLDSFGHDAINRGILVEQRLKRLGVPQYCTTCEGHGYVYTAPKAHVNLVLWILHPRKGASRGVEVKNIKREQLPTICDFLAKAADRNAKRFEKVVREQRRLGIEKKPKK